VGEMVGMFRFRKADRSLPTVNIFEIDIKYLEAAKRILKEDKIKFNLKQAGRLI